RAANDVRRFPSQQWNVGRLCAIGRGCEEAEEAIFAAHLAVRVEALDCDVVEKSRAVHRRARGRLGDYQKLGPARIRFYLGRQRSEARVDVLAARIAQDTEARLRNHLQRVLTFDGHEIMAAITEKREMVVGKPVDEG